MKNDFESSDNRLNYIRVSQVYEKSYSTFFSLLLVISLLVYVLRDTVNYIEINLWYGIIFLLTIVRVINSYLFQKNESNKEFGNYSKWENRFCCFSCLTAIIISLGAFYFFPKESVIHQLFVILILVGLMAGSISSYASSIKISVSYLLILLIPIVFAVFMQGNEMYSILGILLVLLGINLTRGVIKINRFIIKGIEFLLANEVFLKKLETANNELEKVNEELKQYDHAVAHDLKNPINTINNYLDIILDKEIKHHNKDELLYNVRRAGKKALNIIDEMLKIALKGGKEEISEVQFEEVFNDINFQLHDLIQEKNASFTSDFKIQKVYCGKSSLTQSLTNIVSNAIKYTPPERIPNVIMKTEEIDEKIIIQVIDNGIGFKEEDLNKVFTKFSRLENVNAKADGHGIGMATVKRLIENCGGNIEIDSIYGEGTTISVILPRKYKNMHNIGDIEKSKSNKKYNILVVDDDPDIKIILNIYTRSICNKIFFALDGKSAMKYFKNNHIDFVIIDMKLENENGAMIVNQIRQLENSNDKMKIIALSATTYEKDFEALKLSGCNGFISKPFNKKILLDGINKILNS